LAQNWRCARTGAIHVNELFDLWQSALLFAIGLYLRQISKRRAPHTGGMRIGYGFIALAVLSALNEGAAALLAVEWLTELTQHVIYSIGLLLLLLGARHWIPAARSDKSRLHAVVNNTVEGIITIDQQGLIRSFNPAAAEIFGYGVQEVLGRNVNLLMPEPYHSQHDHYMHSYLQGGPAKIIGIGREVRGQRKDGSQFPMELSVGEMVLDDGVGFVGVVRDISWRKQMEEQLKQALRDAEAASAAKSEFLNVISHELKSPLTAITGNIDLLYHMARWPEMAALASQPQRPLLDPLLAKVQQLALGMQERSAHLLALINDLLDFAQLDHGPLEITPGPVASQQLAQRALDVVRPLAEQQGVVLEVQCTTEWIYADEERLLRVLINLLSNAIRFTPAGGRVELRCYSKRHRTIILVSDTGIGMAAEEIPYIFDRFFQSSRSTTREVGGTGLGLAISDRLVRLHDGYITVSSTLDRGTTFAVNLPRHGEDADACCDCG